MKGGGSAGRALALVWTALGVLGCKPQSFQTSAPGGGGLPPPPPGGGLPTIGGGNVIGPVIPPIVLDGSGQQLAGPGPVILPPVQLPSSVGSACGNGYVTVTDAASGSAFQVDLGAGGSVGVQLLVSNWNCLGVQLVDQGGSVVAGSGSLQWALSADGGTTATIWPGEPGLSCLHGGRYYEVHGTGGLYWGRTMSDAVTGAVALQLSSHRCAGRRLDQSSQWVMISTLSQ